VLQLVLKGGASLQGERGSEPARRKGERQEVLAALQAMIVIDFGFISTKAPAGEGGAGLLFAQHRDLFSWRQVPGDIKLNKLMTN
jgi:hypothetical protein